MKCKQNKWVRAPECGNPFEHLTPSTSISAYPLEHTLQTISKTDVLMKVTVLAPSRALYSNSVLLALWHEHVKFHNFSKVTKLNQALVYLVNKHLTGSFLQHFNTFRIYILKTIYLKHFLYESVL